MAQSVPPEVQPRVWEYAPGFNVGQLPRATEPISFAQLRSLANLEDITRMAIETRKDQVEKIPFTARLTPIRGEAKSETKARAQEDDRLDEVNSFLKSPGRVLYYPLVNGQPGAPQLKQMPWNGWLRALLEDLLVVDAPAVMVRRNLKGGPFSFDVMDGALWKPVLDNNGHATSYQQWLYGVPGETLGPTELIYMPRNPRPSRAYGFSPVEQLVFTINLLLRRESKQLAHYTAGNIPEAVLRMPETWNPDQIEKFQKNFDAYVSGSVTSRSKMLFMPGGSTPVQLLGQDSLKTEEDEWWARKVAYAFSLSPMWAVKQQSRAQSESVQEEALEQGLTPLLDFLGTLLTQLVTVGFGYQDVEVVSEFRRDIDPKVQAEIDKTHSTIGAVSINEIREAAGRDAIPGGERYYLTTPGRVYEVTGEGLQIVGGAAPAPDGETVPGQRLLTDGKQEPPSVKKRHYAADNSHVILDRLARLEKAQSA
jgi:hypothetical protein